MKFSKPEGTVEPISTAFIPSDKEVPSHIESFYGDESKAEKQKEETIKEKLKREMENLEREVVNVTGETREKIQKDIDAIRNELGQKEESPKEQIEKTPDEADKNTRIDEIKAEIQQEEKLGKEAEEIKKELEEMPTEKLEEVGIGLRNFGFFAKEYKSKVMAGIFESAGDKKQIQEAEGFTGSVKRWMQGYAQSYRKDEEAARKNIEETEEFKLSLKQVGNVGFVAGETMKHGRTVADVLGWTAGSPLRYAMFGAQIFARGAGAAKEARLMNTAVIDKTRIQDMDEAAEEAWKIYENAQAKAEGKGEKVSKQNLEKSYVENLPADLLKRLEKSEPGMATGILQKVLRKDLEFAIKHGKIKIGEDGKVEKLFENSFNDRLKEYDRLVSRYGTVDALAMGAKYAETAGKAVIAAVSIETATLGVKALFDRFPDIMGRLAKATGGALAGGFVGKKVGGKKGAVMGAAIGAILGASGGGMDEEIPGGGNDVLTEYQEGKRFPMGERPVEVTVPAPVPEKLEGLQESSIIQKGEGIEHAFIRQLSDKPEKFGFTGDSKNDEAVMEWAGGEAHRIAIKAGYVDMETGDEIRVGGKGGDAAYEIVKDSNGNFKVNEYLKDDQGNFKGQEINEVAKDFKSAQFETDRESQEYEYEKPEEQATGPVIEAPIKEALIVPESSDEAIAGYQPPVYDTPRSAIGSETLGRGEVYAEGVEEPTQKYTYNMPKSIDSEQILGAVIRQTNNDIDKLFGTKRFFGVGGTKGVDSLDWNAPKAGFKDIPVKDILDKDLSVYEKTGQKDLGVGIENSGSTEKMQNYLKAVAEETGINPNTGEKTGDFLTRALMEKINRGPIVPEQPVNAPEAEYQTLEDRAEATGGPTISEEQETPEERVEPKVEPARNMPSVDHEQVLAIKTQKINNDIDKMFGSRGFLGIGKASGMESSDWSDPKVGFANKTVAEVMGTTSGKPRVSSYGRVVERNFGIKSSAATKDMQEYLTATFKETGAQPEKGENVADYLKRTVALRK
ncbi:MAG: hypothetical protein AAB497_04105 [Patescibacteria group bacterium]